MSEEDAKFDAIVAYARETNPFYAEWLEGKESVPILTRRILQENNDRILNGHPITGKTSGSSGMPVRISMSPRRHRILRDITARYTEWIGGPLISSVIVSPRDLSPQSELSAAAPLEQQIEWLIKRHEHAGAVALITYPTNGMMLAEAILEHERDMGFMRRVGLLGESFDREQRTYIQSAFPNALVYSTYSSVEFGMISGQCPHEPDFHHIMTDCYRVEVLDDNECACPEGEIGRVIITDYFNECSPLIRYEIGDLAARGSCPCGRIPFPSFSAVLGKVRGTLKHRSGQRVVFFDLSIALRDVPGMKQYQVVQEELERFTVRLVMDEPREEEIAAVFEAHFGYRPQLTFEYQDFIAREPSGKFHASICRI
jgi:phenylacetate-CoA ligase